MMSMMTTQYYLLSFLMCFILYWLVAQSRHIITLRKIVKQLVYVISIIYHVTIANGGTGWP